MKYMEKNSREVGKLVLVNWKMPKVIRYYFWNNFTSLSYKVPYPPLNRINKIINIYKIFEIYILTQHTHIYKYI